MSPLDGPSLILPPGYMKDGVPDSAKYISDLIAFTISPFVHSVITSHCNLIAGNDSQIPPLWDVWWNSDWIDEMEFKSTVESLILNHPADDVCQQIPEPIKAFVNQVHALSLPRQAVASSGAYTIRDDQRFGLTPKKRHEVERLCSLIADLSSRVTKSGAEPIRHIVDVGAGQGYLTRNLASTPLSFQVLALDSSDHQVQGAAQRRRELKKWQDKNAGRKYRAALRKDLEAAGLPVPNHFPSTPPSEDTTEAGISSQTIFVDSEALPHAITEWIDDRASENNEPEDAVKRSQIPIITVGLHACGALTPAVLRSFVSMAHSQQDARDSRPWRCSALALVGCCYNRIRDIDANFPLSNTVRDHPLRPSLVVESAHLHLAAQVTHDWLDDWPGFELGLRKIVYRGMLERLFKDDHHGEMYKAGLAVGRFSDTAYTSWDEYLKRAAERLKMPLKELKERETKVGMEGSERIRRRLEFLHVLRCMAGPVIESLLLMDRWMMLREELEDGIEIRMINLFDQSTGSARNVALVVEL